VTKITNLFQTITKSPVVWGILAAAAFYGLVHGGPLSTPFIKRYFTSHPVEYAETVMFAIGLAALLMKLLDAVGQYKGLEKLPLTAATHQAPSLLAQCQELLEWLGGRQEGYYTGRLRAAIQYLQRRGTAEGLDDQLKYLADLDASRSHANFAMFRVIVWAIPIMGFLGTVIGITMALNGIDQNALDESMQHVLKGLGLKFDTTALALAMSMVLMFVHFFVDRAESLLLEKVDCRVEEDLSGRFQLLPPGGDGQLAAVRRMAETTIQASQRLVQQQAELWHASMEAAAQRWAHLTDGAAEVLKRSLVESLTEGLTSHAQHLAAAEQAAAEQNRRHWSQYQQIQAQQVQAVAALQAAVTRQAEILGRAVEAGGEVSRLEDALNRNLGTLAGTKHFEQTALGLAAAVHLLNARLAETAAEKPAIQLDPGRRAAHAA
jgi:biopolymer transport protein ExbB/TolQ